MPRPERLRLTDNSDFTRGRVVWAPVKSLWFSFMAITALVAGPLMLSWGAVTMCGLLTAATLCFGHSVGLHRLLIHRSFSCPKWLEYCMVYAGMLVGMGGPQKVIWMHESRDWAQRQKTCHPFFIHQSHILKDWLWNMHCQFRFDLPPTFDVESRVSDSTFYGLLDRYWMATQVPVAMLLYFFGGWAWVVWGICVRVTISLTGHWLVGFIAHNCGEMPRRVEGASVQGFNVRGLGLITMGEAWHNNHHAYPDSARLGLEHDQNDPGWWLLCVLSNLGLVTDITLPEHLPARPELVENYRPVFDELSSSILIPPSAIVKP